jgi:hypothetical protein
MDGAPGDEGGGVGVASAGELLLEALFEGGIEGERHGESIPPGPMGRHGFLRAYTAVTVARERKAVQFLRLRSGQAVAAGPSLRPFDCAQGSVEPTSNREVGQK